MANTGKYNRKITLTTPGTLTPSDLGFTEGSSLSVTLFCHARQLSMREKLSYGLETHYAAYEFRCRYYSADFVTAATRITFESRSFRLVNFMNPDEEKDEIIMIANEEK